MTVASTAPRSGPRRRQRTSPRTEVVTVLAIGAAVAAAVVSDAAPTGTPVVDLVYRCGLAALVTVAAARAHRWTLVLGGLLTTVAAGGWLRVPCAVALAAAVVLLATHQRERAVRAAAGGTIAVGALSLTWPSASLVTAGIAAVAVVPILWTGVRRFHHRGRTAVGALAAALLVVAVAGVAGAAAFALGAADDVRAGVREATAAAGQLGSADATEASTRFAAAGERFRSVDRTGDSWWLLPARAVPVVAPHLRLARDAARSGSELGDLAGDVAIQAGDERLRRPDGGVDLDRLAALSSPAARARRELGRVQRRLDTARSPWLVPPVETQARLLDQRLSDAVRAAGVAELAARRVPTMLGADRPHRYLFLLGNPAEARDIGGHIGNWAEVVASQGRIEVRRVGQPYDLYNPTTLPHPVPTPGAYPQSLVELRPELFPQNWGGSPDLPTVGRLAADMWRQVNRGERLDGVAYADPAAFAALLRFTGPVTVPASGDRLTPDNAVDFLTRRQFEVLPQTGRGGEPLGDVIRDTLRRFTSGRLPAPAALGRELGDVVRNGHLQFASLHAEDDPLLDATGLRGAVERPGAGDLLAVLTRNANPSKIDAYLRRRITYDVAWNTATGETRAVLKVRLTNSAPASGLPGVVIDGAEGTPRGTNRTQLCVLSPLGVRTATVDGSPTGVGTLPELRGVDRHCMFVDLPPGRTRTVQLNLLGTLGAGVPYLLQWTGQPTLGPDSVRITVSADRTTVDGGHIAAVRRPDAAEDRLLRVVPDVYDRPTDA